MEQTRFINLPVIGRVQHGDTNITEKGSRKVKELGYFIAKIQDSFMEKYLKKFDDIYKGQKSIDIKFFDENPLSIKFVRFNQSGEVCSCPNGSNIARQKTKNGWDEIECNSRCQYRQKNEQGKQACNRMAWLKFIIPSICEDRIWLMRITGQKSINRINDYINLQKMQGNSIKGNYTLYLKQEEQSNFKCQTFNNYVLDILKQENLNSNEQIPQNIKNHNEESTDNEKNVNETVENKSKTKNKKKASNSKVENKDDLKNTTNKKIEHIQNPDMDKCYLLIGKHYKELENKGQMQKYYIAEFHDISDNPIDIIISPEYIQAIDKYEIGTVLEIEIKKYGDKNVATNIRYVQNEKKEIAA